MDNEVTSDTTHSNAPSYVIIISACAGLISAAAAFVQALPTIKDVFTANPRIHAHVNGDSPSGSSRDPFRPPAVSYCNSEDEWGRTLRSNDLDTLRIYILRCGTDGKFLPEAEREFESRLFTKASECIHSASACNLTGCIDIYLRPLPNGGRGQALRALAANFQEADPRCRPPPPANEEATFCPGPSYDCNQAANTIEQLVCRDAELACLDSNLALAFNERLASLAPSRRRILRQEERDWLHRRDSQCDLSTPAKSIACAKAFYGRRITQLQK